MELALILSVVLGSIVSLTTLGCFRMYLASKLPKNNQVSNEEFEALERKVKKLQYAHDELGKRVTPLILRTEASKNMFAIQGR